VGGLEKSSAVGSRLAVDFYPPRDTGTSLSQRQTRLQRLARFGSGETIRLTIDRSEAVELVARGLGRDRGDESAGGSTLIGPKGVRPSCRCGYPTQDTGGWPALVSGSVLGSRYHPGGRFCGF